MSRVVPISLALVCLAFCPVLNSCSVPTTDDSRPLVFVSIPPQAYLVERLGGEVVDVRVLLEPGHSPATYDPPPRLMADLSKADLLFTIGVPFERRLTDRFASAMSDLRVVDTRQGIALQPIIDHEHHGHEAHEGEELDPHIWLSPRLARTISTTMADALKSVDPGHAEMYDARLVELLQDLDSVDAVVRDLLAPVHGERLYVFHPAYGYFARDYGLNQVAIEVSGKEPSIRELVEIVSMAQSDSVMALFVQPQFSADEVHTISERIGASVAVLDPLAHDYLDNLVKMASAIAAALGSDPGAGHDR